MKRILLLLFIVLFSSCCNCFIKIYNNNRVKNMQIYNEVNESYKNQLSLFDSTLINFLPEIETGFLYHYSISTEDTCTLNYIYLIMFYSDEQFEEIEHFAQNNSIQKYHFSDSCLMLTNYNANLKIFNKYNFKNCENLSSSMLPITNFEFCKNNPIITKKFFKKATIYLLGAERGKFLPDYKLTNKGVGLPDGWEHGYTRGMAIWCNTVVYWLEVW